VPILTRLEVRPGDPEGDIMLRISALLACLAVVATAGCATARATATGHPKPPCRYADNVITQADSGKTYCVRVGDQVAVILHSTQRDLWQAPRASGNVLEGVPNGAFSLVVGATGAQYKATRAGRSVLTSVRPPCRAGRSCAAKDRFTVTIVVR
jgi:hypothetical protein